MGNKIKIDKNVNIEVFYKEKTKEIVTPLVEKYSKIMSLTPSEIKYRKAKRRWGSCSGRNSISFNSSLSQLPLSCIEYIIVHELSHILHKHHQKDFWLHVEKFMPSFKEQEKELKKYFPAI